MPHLHLSGGHVEGERRAPSWLTAAIRAVLIATAVGGGFFVLSQVLAPAQAHAETVGHASDPALLDPVLKGTGGLLGGATETVDSAAGARGVGSAGKQAAGTTTAVVSDVVKALPPVARKPVVVVTAPVARSVSTATAPVTRTLSAVPAARPVSTAVGSVSSMVDTVVADTEKLPVAGSIVGRLVGSDPVTTVTSPAAGNLDDLVGQTVGSVAGAVSQTSGAVSVIGSRTSSAALPLPGSTDVARALTGEFYAPSGARTGSGTPAAVLVPFGPFFDSGMGPLVGLARAAHQASVPAAIVGDSGAPALPSLPGLPGSLLSNAAAGSAASTFGGNGGPAPLGGTLDNDFFPATLAGAPTLGDADAVPASPVFDHDSTPD